MKKALKLDVIGDNELCDTIVKLAAESDQFVVVRAANINHFQDCITVRRDNPDVIIVADITSCNAVPVDRILKNVSTYKIPMIYGARESLVELCGGHMVSLPLVAFAHMHNTPIGYLPYADRDFVSLFKHLRTQLCAVGTAPCTVRINTTHTNGNKAPISTGTLAGLVKEATNGRIVPTIHHSSTHSLPPSGEVHQVFINSPALSRNETTLISTASANNEEQAKGLLRAATSLDKLVRPLARGFSYHFSISELANNA